MINLFFLSFFLSSTTCNLFPLLSCLVGNVQVINYSLRIYIFFLLGRNYFSLSLSFSLAGIPASYKSKLNMVTIV